MKTNEFTKKMKAELNNENNLFNEFELKLYGVQAYGVTYGEEFNVIVKAARRANGRYYFITREGYEIAWHTLPADQVEHICADMYDRHESDEKTARESYDRLKANGTAHVRAEIMNNVYELADAEGVAVFVLTGGTDEINRVYYVCSLGTTADEGRAIARAAAADDSESQDTTTTAAPAADDLTADDLKAEAEKVARYMMDSAAPVVAEIVNGAFVYHVGHDLPYNLSEAAAERVALYLEDRETIAARALEMGGPSEFFENERAAARAALQRMNAAVITWGTTPAPADDHQDTTTTTAAEVISESEPTAAPAAGSLAAKVATAARVFLLACCLSAADGLTAAPAGSPAADDLTPCELLTVDPLAEVIRLQAAGLTVSHVTIKSTTPAAC